MGSPDWMAESASERQKLIDQPNAEYYHDYDLRNLGEWLRQGNLRENPPDQPKDDAHDEDGDQKAKHDAIICKLRPRCLFSFAHTNAPISGAAVC